MEQIGPLLKQAREKKKLSIEKIAEDTNISKKFIEALENEEFSIFPGEAYLKGFLRTYSEYLKLDADDIIKKYETIKISETPLPMEELIPKPTISLRPILTITLLVILVLGIGSGAFFGIKYLISSSDKTQNKDLIVKKNNDTKKDKKKTSDEHIYQLNENEKERTFDLKQNDIVEFEVKGKKYNFKIEELNPIVTFKTSTGKEDFLVNETSYKIDYNEDSINDLELILNNWNSTTANITAKLLDQAQQVVAINKNDKNKLIGENPETIASSSSVQDIELALKINPFSYLRYKVDDNEPIEKFYSEKSVKNITAKRQVIVWMANSGLNDFFFQTYNENFSPGELGEVSVKLIQWNKLDSGEYALQVSSLK